MATQSTIPKLRSIDANMHKSTWSLGVLSFLAISNINIFALNLDGFCESCVICVKKIGKLNIALLIFPLRMKKMLNKHIFLGFLRYAYLGVFRRGLIPILCRMSCRTTLK